MEWRQDSDFGERDTGVKLAMFYVLFAKGTKPGRISIKEVHSGRTKHVELVTNTLVMFNARAFSYEIEQPNVSMIICTMVGGPAQPPLHTGASFK